MSASPTSSAGAAESLSEKIKAGNKQRPTRASAGAGVNIPIPAEHQRLRTTRTWKSQRGKRGRMCAVITGHTHTHRNYGWAEEQFEVSLLQLLGHGLVLGGGRDGRPGGLRQPETTGARHTLFNCPWAGAKSRDGPPRGVLSRSLSVNNRYCTSEAKLVGFFVCFSSAKLVNWHQQQCVHVCSPASTHRSSSCACMGALASWRAEFTSIASREKLRSCD